MALHEDKELFRKYINEVSVNKGVNPSFIEKDYWICFLLKTILSKDIDYVFKGGTSLSKCYKLIDRFSEDIDIAYESNYDDLGPSKKDRRFKGITQSIKKCGLEVSNTESLRRDRYFNRFICPYNSVLPESEIAPEILIELAAQTPSFPVQKKYMQSYLGEYFNIIGRDDLVEKFELESFKISVQSLERTFVDKTFAICDYYLSHNIGNHSRHLYDLYKIVSHIKLDDDLYALFQKIKTLRKKNAICVSAKDGIVLHDLLSEIIDGDVYEKDYETRTFGLLYEKVPYKECITAIRKLRDYLKEHYEY